MLATPSDRAKSESRAERRLPAASPDGPASSFPGMPRPAQPPRRVEAAARRIADALAEIADGLRRAGSDDPGGHAGRGRQAAGAGAVR
jgi:hypothetical protein